MLFLSCLKQQKCTKNENVSWLLGNITSEFESLTLSDDDVPHNLQVSSLRLHPNFSCEKHFTSEFGPVYVLKGIEYE